MKNKILGGLMLVLVLCFTACEDEQLFGRDGNTTIRISATAKFSGAESRAVLATEYKATENNVFMLYKGTDKNATLEVMEAMTSLEGTIENVRIEGGATYTAIMIANVRKSEDLVSQGVVVGSKLEALYSATYAVNTTDNKPTDAAAFTWSGVVCGITTANVRNGLKFELNPNVARLRVDVKNNASKTSQFSADKINLVNIQVKNVAKKVRFAQNALQDAKLFTSADNGIASASDVLDYEIEAMDLSNEESATYEWYVPCNMLEPAKNTGSRAEKAPAYATYIEIDGIRRLDFMDTAYKVYPGVKNSNEVYENIPNYYVKADYKYTVNVKIDDDGLKYDVVNSSDKDNATAPEKVVFPAGSNCFMVHPKISATANGTIYEVPIDQANRFWSMKDATRVIGENDEWKAVFIWQDIPGEQVMYFCDEKGSNITKSHAFPDYASLTEYYAEGKGHEPIRFKLVDTETYGNVLIGIRKNGVSDYLWSWHLWVTDYNPDAAPTPSQARTMYNTYSANGMYVENGDFEIDKHPVKYINGGTSLNPTYGDAQCFGNVQHFYQYYTTKYWTGASATIWDWDKGGMYANKWIMDRNLGAQGPGNGDIENAWDAFGLYYQFGRKDPFPYINYNAEKDYLRRKVYDINGNVINKWKDASLSSNSKNKVIGVRLKSGGSFEESVKNPFTLYSGVETTWASASSLSDVKSEYWYGLESGKHKSIFDPCPPGWCVPVSEAFQFATVEQPAGVYTNSNSYTNVYASFSVYVHMRGWYNTSNPEYHRNFAILTSLGCINGSASPNKHLDSVFPSQGYIADNGSSIYGLIIDDKNRKDIRGCYWTARGSGVNGEMLQFKPVNYVTLTNNKYTHSSSDTGNGNDFGYDITEVFYARFPRVDNPDNGVLLYHRMNTPLRIWNFVASRAQPVRCIQEPNN